MARRKPETAEPGETSVFVALLRGVNVGGKNRLPMNDLSAMFAAEGCDRVRTYIQSGNVVFRAQRDAVGPLIDRTAARVEKKFGFRPHMVVRPADVLERVTRENPFLVPGADEKALHVAFLDATPDPARVAALDPDRSPPDAFAVVGSHLYLCCPNGLGRSRLTNDYFDRALATVSTVRNWNTVLTLAAWCVEDAAE